MPLTTKIAFCTTREAAELLGVSLRTTQMWVESGLLEAWKTDGGHRRIMRSSVEKLLSRENTAGLPSPVAPSQRLKILVVEDDNALLKLYKLRISGWDFPVDLSMAANGYEGLMRIGRESPDLLILDLRMPGMDGFQMLQALAVSPLREGMEIVVVTGLSAEEIADRGGLPRGVTLLPKPVPFTQLRELAEGLLAQREAVECST